VRWGVREARDLRPGTRWLRTNGPQWPQMESVEESHGAETVYDLTVEKDHSFVTEAGVGAQLRAAARRPMLPSSGPALDYD